MTQYLQEVNQVGHVQNLGEEVQVKRQPSVAFDEVGLRQDVDVRQLNL